MMGDDLASVGPDGHALLTIDFPEDDEAQPTDYHLVSPEEYDELTSEDETPDAYEDLADLLDNWSDHITVELPEGTYVAIDENFEGDDPTPTVRLSDELKDVLDRIHEEGS